MCNENLVSFIARGRSNQGSTVNVLPHEMALLNLLLKRVNLCQEILKLLLGEKSFIHSAFIWTLCSLNKIGIAC